MKGRILVNTFGVATLALLFGTSSPWAAQDAASAHRQLESRKPVQGVIDVLNLFPQVGALLIVVTPNDFGVSCRDRGVLQRHTHSRAGLSDGRALHGAGVFRSPSSLHPGVCQSEPERARPLDLASSCRTDHPPLDPSLSAAIGM